MTDSSENTRSPLKQRILNLVKTLSFLCVLALSISWVSNLMTTPSLVRDYQLMAGFYEEREDSLDAVYIGASHVFAYWQPPLAWGNYGIAVYSFASSRQPITAARYMIEEARKTQPDALYIVSINSIVPNYDILFMHCLSDFLPASSLKFRMLQDLLDRGEYELKDRFEFYFPLLRYHDRWSELTVDDFEREIDGLKAGMYHRQFLNLSRNFSGLWYTVDERMALDEEIETSVNELMDYCDAENVRVMFICAPQIKSDETLLAQYNTIEDMVRARGYDLLDLRDHIDEMQLDFSTDYYDSDHTNIHGSVKTTDFIARYLIDHYGFTDKRANIEYSDWNQAYFDYIQEINQYSLDFEYMFDHWEKELPSPKVTLSVNGSSVSVSWSEVEGADGYAVYRKQDGEAWKRLAKVYPKEQPEAESDGPQTVYLDETAEPFTTYQYTVAAFAEDEDGVHWGNHRFAGYTATALLDPPEGFIAADAGDAIWLSWNEVEGADGYLVYKGVNTASLHEIADVGPHTHYLDQEILGGTPYLYNVCAYTLNEDESISTGEASEYAGYLPEIEVTGLTVTLQDGKPLLTWDKQTCVNRYYIRRSASGRYWEDIAYRIPGDYTSFVDLTAKDGVEYTYSVNAVVAVGEFSAVYSAETETPVTASGEALNRDPAAGVRVIACAENVIITWTPDDSEGEDYSIQYRVYRYDFSSATWAPVSLMQTNNALVDVPQKSGVYAYAVRRYYVFEEATYAGRMPRDTSAVASFDTENVKPSDMGTEDADSYPEQ